MELSALTPYHHCKGVARIDARWLLDPSDAASHDAGDVGENGQREGDLNRHQERTGGTVPQRTEQWTNADDHQEITYSAGLY
ncbi:MAG: hypothetical protein M0038_10315 [Pseudomonadota bacterium]|nr:hypothetical protein [Pseudomonadota bacterium]